MSINTTGAKLWFDTQAEIDDYDNLMIANIELKTEDYEDENFTIVATRSKKEIMPGNHNSLLNNSVAKMEAFGIGKSHMRIGELGYTGTRSLMINNMYYISKSYASWIFAYFVLRELPIRNFYARSLLMFYFGVKFVAAWGGPTWDTINKSRPVEIRYNHFLEKERKIFHWLQETDALFNQQQEGRILFKLVYFPTDLT